ncbi:MAG: hypothetical protein MI861_28265, partial [Pirellulales bacterium]|nr:hypothetical protein [Pirellulales bacterium]
EAIESIESTYQDFVTKIKMNDGQPDLSDLPEGWRRGGKKPFRFASIDVQTRSKQLDISISNLGRQSDWDEFVSMNVNRWRGQLGLDPSDEKWAGGQPVQIAVADGDSVWVDLIGQPGENGGMSSAPFANRMAPPSSPPRQQTANQQQTARQQNSPLKFELPDGWREGETTSMRWAAFNVGPEDSSAKVTVIPAGGDLRDNVARWLGEIRPDGVADEAVDQALADVKEIKVDGRPSQRFLLTGSGDKAGDAIDVTIVPLDDGFSLFVKMFGPAATVTGHAEEVTSFLESLKLQI